MLKRSLQNIGDKVRSVRPLNGIKSTSTLSCILLVQNSYSSYNNNFRKDDNLKTLGLEKMKIDEMPRLKTKPTVFPHISKMVKSFKRFLDTRGSIQSKSGFEVLFPNVHSFFENLLIDLQDEKLNFSGYQLDLINLLLDVYKLDKPLFT
jgi:hypothetical protein